jgi:hypothetical protein
MITAAADIPQLNSSHMQSLDRKQPAMGLLLLVLLLVPFEKGKTPDGRWSRAAQIKRSERLYAHNRFPIDSLGLTYQQAKLLAPVPVRTTNEGLLFLVVDGGLDCLAESLCSRCTCSCFCCVEVVLEVDEGFVTSV